MYRYLICAVLPAAFALSAADVKIEAAEYSFGSPALPLVLRFGAADGLRYTLTLTDTFTGKTAAKQEGPVTAERLPLRAGSCRTAAIRRNSKSPTAPAERSRSRRAASG